MSGGLGRAWVLAAFPVYVGQGLWTRRRTPRLDDADGAAGRVGDGDDPIRVLVVGDSVAMAVGVDHHRHSIAGRLAAIGHDRNGLGASWRVIGRTGAEAADLATILEETAPEELEADVVVVSLGVNDTKNLCSDDAWRSGLGDSLVRLRLASPDVPLVVLGVPPMAMFPALPTPLRHLLGARATRLDEIAREAAAAYGALHVPLSGLGLTRTPEMFAADGLHPGALAHAALAEHIAELLWGRVDCPGSPGTP